jgi:hypothetical protein
MTSGDYGGIIDKPTGTIDPLFSSPEEHDQLTNSFKISVSDLMT